MTDTTKLIVALLQANPAAQDAVWNDARLYGTGFFMMTADGVKRIAPQDIILHKPSEDQPNPKQTTVECTMCMDTRECPECGSSGEQDEHGTECTMCAGSGDCPECGGSDDDE